MYYGLYLSAAGAAAQGQKVEVLTNNLANVDTVGFKRELALLEARDSEAIERGLSSRGSRSLNDIGGGTGQNETATDFHAGTLRATGIPTDMALEGTNAFFLVQRGNEQVLTRAGNFRLDADGRLLTGEGDQVLATDGTPIQIDAALPWNMTTDGQITQAGDVREIALRKASDLRALSKAGHNYFAAPAKALQPLSPDERRVRQGYVEMSGVNPIQEMVELIATQRSYETSTRMIQNHDTMTGTLISRMLRA